MTTDVLNQLRALRESIAEGLRKDPRYLTLAALDRSIVEISGVLSAAGFVVPPETAVSAPLHLASPPTADPVPATTPTPTPVFDTAPAPVEAPEAAVPPVPTAGASDMPAVVADAPGESIAPAAAADQIKKKKKSISPVETAALLAVAGIGAEVMHENNAAAANRDSEKPALKASEHQEDAPEDARHPNTEEPEADEGKHEDHDARGDQDKSDQDESDEDKSDEDKGNDKDADGGDEEKGDEAADEAAVIPKGKASGYTPMAPKAGGQPVSARHVRQVRQAPEQGRPAAAYDADRRPG